MDSPNDNEGMRSLILDLDANLDQLSDIRERTLQFQLDTKIQMAKLSKTIERQNQLIMEQETAIRSQNRVMLKVLKALRGRDPDELFLCDQDTNRSLKCCFDCNAKIDAMTFRLMHERSDVETAAQVLTKSVKNATNSSKNKEETEEEMDETDNQEQNELSMENDDESKISSNLSESPENGIGDSQASESASEYGYDNDALEVDISEDELLMGTPEPETVPPTPKPRRKVVTNELSLMPTRGSNKNGKQNPFFNRGNQSTTPTELTIRKVTNNEMRDGGIKNNMRIKVSNDLTNEVIKTNKMTALTPMNLDCDGSSLPTLLVKTGIPCQPYSIMVTSCKRTNCHLEIIHFQVLQTNNARLAQEFKKSNLYRFSIITSDFKGTKCYIKSAVVRTVYHSNTHTLAFIECYGEVLCTFEKNEKLKSIRMCVDNDYNRRIVTVFPKKNGIRWNDELVDIVLVSDAEAIKKNHTWIQDVELIDIKRGRNICFALEFDKSNKKNMNHAKKRRN